MGTQQGAYELVIQVLAREPIHILRLAGHLTLRDASTVLAALTVALQGSEHGTVIVEVSDLTVASTPMLLAFPTALRHCGGWPLVTLHLAGARGPISGQLQALRMHRYLTLHDTLSDAVLAAQRELRLQRYAVRLDAQWDNLAVARAAARYLWPTLSSAEAIVNELVANAIDHAAVRNGRTLDGTFLLALAATEQSCYIAVTDPTNSVPAPQYDPDERYGLRIVAGLAQEWGVRPLHPAGKTVWAALDLASA